MAIINGTTGDDLIDLDFLTPPTDDADTITGLAGDDVIFGLGGIDTIDGGADADTIDGGLGADVMVGHLSVPGLTDADGVPASLSPAAYALLRADYASGDVLLFTDALGMNAVSDRFTLPDAAIESIRAGADVVIFTDTDATPAVLARLGGAVADGSLARARVADAAARVLARKGIDPCVTGA